MFALSETNRTIVPYHLFHILHFLLQNLISQANFDRRHPTPLILNITQHKQLSTHGKHNKKNRVVSRIVAQHMSPIDIFFKHMAGEVVWKGGGCLRAISCRGHLGSRAWYCVDIFVNDPRGSSTKTKKHEWGHLGKSWKYALATITAAIDEVDLGWRWNAAPWTDRPGRGSTPSAFAWSITF